MSTPAWGEAPEREVAWNGDGTYTPQCSACGWSGKAREFHADAVSAVRSHRTSRRHIEHVAATSEERP